MYLGRLFSTTSLKGGAGSASVNPSVGAEADNSVRLGGGELRSKRSRPWKWGGKIGCLAAASSESGTIGDDTAWSSIADIED
jgi:hypothetical protein